MLSIPVGGSVQCDLDEFSKYGKLMDRRVKQNSVTWISHRGLSRSAPENTLRAFEAAVACGFSVLETDLRLTADGHIVLSHDRSLERVFGVSLDVMNSTREEIENCGTPQQGKVLFLDQFIEAFPGTGWTFDIKPENGEKTIQVLLEWIRKRKFRDWFMAQARFLLWERSQEAMVRQELPNAVFYARSRECWRAGLSALVGLPMLAGIDPKKIYSLPPKAVGRYLYNESMIQSFHSRGARVLAYLPNTEGDVKAAVTAGVDEVLLDIEIPRGLSPASTVLTPTEVR